MAYRDELMAGGPPALEDELMMGEASAPEDPAASMNSGLEQIIQLIGDLEMSAQENGVYDDPSSMNALMALKAGAQKIYDRWMAGESEEEPAPEPKHVPGKLIKKGNYAGKGPRPDELSNSNVYGGQIFKIKGG